MGKEDQKIAVPEKAQNVTDREKNNGSADPAISKLHFGALLIRKSFGSVSYESANGAGNNTLNSPSKQLSE